MRRSAYVLCASHACSWLLLDSHAMPGSPVHMQQVLCLCLCCSPTTPFPDVLMWMCLFGAFMSVMCEVI